MAGIAIDSLEIIAMILNSRDVGCTFIGTSLSTNRDSDTNTIDANQTHADEPQDCARLNHPRKIQG